MTPPTSTRRLFLTHMGAAAIFQGAAPGRLRATSAPAPHACPQDLGLDPTRLDRAYALVQRMLSPRPEYGAAILVGRGDQTLAPRTFGRMGTHDAPAVSPDTIFLIASCTKPIVASAACLLIERGLLELNQPLYEIIPEVAEEQNGIRLIHLMTHTSGFGSIPRNQEFRATRQPLDRFVREMFKRRTFDFAPGTGVKYCNAGFALLSEVICRTSGMATRDFLEKEFFRPLGMPDSFLGRTDQDRSRISDCVLPPELAVAVSNWNSDYFHRLGNPWGGIFSTVRDYTRFLQMLLNGGEYRGVRIFSPATVRMMTRNQIPRLPGLSPAHRIAYATGFGWQMRDNGHFQFMGSLVSPRAFGHYGVTGCSVWADPETGVFMTLFSNKPQSDRELGIVSNAVAASLVE